MKHEINAVVVVTVVFEQLHTWNSHGQMMAFISIDNIVYLVSSLGLHTLEDPQYSNDGTKEKIRQRLVLDGPFAERN